MAASSSRRALHYVFKVADRASTAMFYRDILGMKVPTYLPTYYSNHINKPFTCDSRARVYRAPGLELGLGLGLGLHCTG